MEGGGHGRWRAWNIEGMKAEGVKDRGHGRWRAWKVEGVKGKDYER